SWGCKVGGYAPKNWCEVAREVITLKSSKTVEVELEGKVLSFFVVPIVEEGYINLYGRDITDRKKMEEELRQSENRYRIVFENTGTGMAIIEDDMMISLVNREFENITGYAREEVEGKKKWTDFIIKEDLDKMMEHHFQRRVDPNTSPRSYEFQGVSKQGVVKTVLLNIDVIPETKKSVASFIDITQRKRTEEDLKASEERFRSVVNAAADAIISIDSQEKIVFWNKAAEDTFGYSADEAIGKPITMMIPEQTRGHHENMMRKFMSSTHSISKVGSIGSARRKDGSLFPIEASFSKWKQKEETFFMAVIRDITERLKMEDELRRYAEHLSELVEEKTKELGEAEWLITMGQVATMVGHDLRNPLQVLLNLGYLEKREVGKLPSPTGIELQDLFATAEKQIEYMNKIVSDLQDYGRTLEPHYTKVKLDKLIADSLAIVNVPERVKVLVDIQEGFPSLV
ncbi:MAG: PAS domain S-box protein, partial [Nitrososphaeria archaeon]